MAIDKVRPLKIENPTEGGTDTDFGPTEVRVDQDYLAAKGISYEGSDSTKSWADAGKMQFVDTEVTSSVSLQDLALRLNLKDVDLTSLTNNYVLTWNTAGNKFNLQPYGGSSGGSGVTPPFVFGKDGNCTIGTYLRTHVVPGGPGGSGQDIKGTDTLVEMNINIGVVATATTRFQLSRRTAVNTWVDITGAYVDVVSGNYTGSRTGLSVGIGPDWEVGCYNQSGATTKNTIVTIYLVPA